MKNKVIAFIIMISLVSGVVPTVFASAEVGKYEIHLSPHGLDENDGTIENPVKTFERARNL